MEPVALTVLFTVYPAFAYPRPWIYPTEDIV